MSAVQLLFTRRRHPGSALIRVTTWSAWSHVDLIDGQSVLGAVALNMVLAINHRADRYMGVS